MGSLHNEHHHLLCRPPLFLAFSESEAPHIILCVVFEIGDLVPKEIPTDPAAIEAIRASAFSRPFLVNRLFSDDSWQAWVSCD
jgi:hypothetical protein